MFPEMRRPQNHVDDRSSRCLKLLGVCRLTVVTDTRFICVNLQMLNIAQD